jgi:hypothetical protein
MPRNTHRQPSASETTPASAGPTRPGTIHARDHAWCRGARVGARDRRVHDRTDRAGPEALDRPPGDDLQHRAGQAGHDHAPGEEDDADRERAARTAPVGIGPGQGDADDVGQPEGAERPAVQVEATEIVDHRRHDGRDGHALECRSGHQPDEPRRQHAALGCPGAADHSMTAGPSRSGDPSFAS